MRIKKSHRELSTSTCAVDLMGEFALGIDLSEKFLDVRKLFMSGFARKVSQRGLDPEDVLQEVYKGLLIRNNGKCPWDMRKSSMGYYVYMVSSNILSNYARKRDRQRSNEVLGWRGIDGEFKDVAVSVICKSDSSDTHPDGPEDLARWILGKVNLDSISKLKLPEVLPLLISGHTKREISKRVGMKNKDVEVILGALREIYA